MSKGPETAQWRNGSRTRVTGRTHQCIGESVTGIFDVSDELFLSEISRPMLPETLVMRLVKPLVTQND